MATAPNPTFTVEQYLLQQDGAEAKAEFFRGQLFAMVGASPRHNQIAENVFHQLRLSLKGADCKPHGSDQRIATPDGLHTYPDVSVVCGDPQYHALDGYAALNPRVLFEVLSSSTEKYDRGKKFDFYRAIDTLQEYILVAQDEPLVEQFTRNKDGSWRLAVLKGLTATLQLPSLNCQVTLTDIYEDVQFGNRD